MKKLTLILILTLLSSCNTKKSSSVKSTVATISGVEVGVCTNQNLGQNQMASGPIYDSSNTSFNFESRVKDLLSASIQPNDVGYISPFESSPSVKFSGTVKLDANGAVIGSTSKVIITVTDSYATMGQQPILIEFNPSNGKGATISGQFDTGSGQGYISLRDSLGEVRFQGTMDAQRFSGNVSFQNTANVTGAANASGVLGQFYIQRCSLFN